MRFPDSTVQLFVNRAINAIECGTDYARFDLSTPTDKSPSKVIVAASDIDVLIRQILLDKSLSIEKFRNLRVIASIADDFSVRAETTNKQTAE